MTFDEQLQQSFGTLSEHLRDEIARALDAARGDVAAHADAARFAAVNEASERVRAEAEADARVEIARVEHRAQELAAASAALEQTRASESAAHEQARAAQAATRERLVAGVRTIDDARSLSDILDTLVNCSSGEAARVAVLLAENGELHGWRFAGFDESVNSRDAMVIPAEVGGILGDAMRAPGAVSAGGSAAPPFAQLPNESACFAMPITLRGEVVAVLYADPGQRADPAQLASAPAWSDALEVFARHASRCLEAVTAIKAVGVLTDTADAALESPAPPATTRRQPEATPSSRDGHPDEESAQRYARLLVSEIKLYNEPAVVAGRYVRDLGTRLASEIAKARDLYEQQIPPEARTVDHFHNELVRTLANGDASLLGPTP